MGGIGTLTWPRCETIQMAPTLLHGWNISQCDNIVSILIKVPSHSTTLTSGFCASSYAECTRKTLLPWDPVVVAGIPASMLSRRWDDIGKLRGETVGNDTCTTVYNVAFAILHCACRSWASTWIAQKHFPKGNLNKEETPISRFVLGRRYAASLFGATLRE